MTRYFFDFREGDTFYSDEEGVELPSLGRAKIEAARAITGHAKEVVTERGQLEIVIEVRTEAGHAFASKIVLETTP